MKEDTTTTLIQKLSTALEILPPEELAHLELPLFVPHISAGFPSPADDYLEDNINLQQLLIHNPSATYLLRVRGDSMRDANISDGDILVVDRSLKPSNNQIIIGLLNDEFTVKRLVKKGSGEFYLQPENPKYPPIKITDDVRFQPWGVVTWCIHKTKTQ